MFPTTDNLNYLLRKQGQCLLIIIILCLGVILPTKYVCADSSDSMIYSIEGHPAIFGIDVNGFYPIGKHNYPSFSVSHEVSIIISNSIPQDSEIVSNNSVIRFTNLPPGNITNKQLYKFTGTADGCIKTAYLTVNDNVQMLDVNNGTFEVEVALSPGVNKVIIVSFNCRGGACKKSYQILFSAPQGGIPIIKLESPANGRQGVKEGDAIMVEGTIDDTSIETATLLMNKIPIQMEVKNGRFSHKVFMPAGRVVIFSVMAKNKNGVTGYSALHTILAGYKIDILIPIYPGLKIKGNKYE